MWNIPSSWLWCLAPYLHSPLEHNSCSLWKESQLLCTHTEKPLRSSRMCYPYFLQIVVSTEKLESHLLASLLSSITSSCVVQLSASICKIIFVVETNCSTSQKCPFPYRLFQINSCNISCCFLYCSFAVGRVCCKAKDCNTGLVPYSSHVL